MMANPSSPAITAQTTNFARLCCVMVDVCPAILRDLVDHHIPPANFASEIKAKQRHIQSVLNRSQDTILYGTSAPSSQDCDLSLLYILLRNICCPTAPLNGWGRPPDENDYTLSACVERLRICRNEVYGHCTKAKVTHADFEKHWKTLKDSVTNIQAFLRKSASSDYVKWMDCLKVETIDPNREFLLIKSIRGDVDRLNNTVADVEMLVASVDNRMTNIESSQSAVINRLDKTEITALGTCEKVQQVDSEVEELGSRLESLGSIVSEVEDTQTRTNDRLGKMEYKVLSSVKHMDQIQTTQEATRVATDELEASLCLTDSRVLTLEATQEATSASAATMESVMTSVSGRIVKMEAGHEATLASVQRCEARLSELENIRKDLRIKGLIEITWNRMKYHVEFGTYVRTTDFDSASRTLVEEHVLIIEAPPGFGKTATCLEVLCELGQMSEKPDDKPLPFIIQSPEEWVLVNALNMRIIVFVDDLGGAANYSSSEFESWKHHFSHMLACAKSGNMLLIMATRSHILSELTQSMTRNDLFRSDHILSLKSTTMSDLEREQILLKKVRVCEFIQVCENKKDESLGGTDIGKISIANETLRDIASRPNNCLGFPQCATLFFSSRNIAHKGLDFFERPLEYLMEEMQLMESEDPLKFLTLVLFLVEGNCLRIEKLFENREILSELSEICGVMSVTPRKVEMAAKHLSSTYFIYDRDQRCYTISHESVLQCLCVLFGERCPSFIIKHSSLHVLCDMLRTWKYVPNVGEIVIRVSQSFYQILSERILNEVISGNVWRVARHTCLRDEEFVNVLFNRANRDKLQQAFHSSDQFNRSLLLCIVDQRTECSLCVSRMIESGLYKDYDSKDEDSWIMKQLQSALFEACSRGHAAVAGELLASGYVTVRDKEIVNACRYQSVLMVSTLVNNRNTCHGIKWHGETPLTAATRKGKTDVVKWLLQHSDCPIDELDDYGNSALHYVALHGYADLMMTFLDSTECAKLISKSNSKGLCPIHVAVYAGMKEVVCVLLSHGVNATVGTDKDTFGDGRGVTSLELCTEGEKYCSQKMIRTTTLLNVTGVYVYPCPVFGSKDEFAAIRNLLSNGSEHT